MNYTFLDKISKKKNKHLSIYITAGYPDFDQCVDLISEMNSYNVSFIELGMPYSDPLADGETIQQSSDVAIKNGMTLKRYFELVKSIYARTNIPIVYMGYLNQIIRFGIENFCKACNDSAIECLIIPDLPVDVYEKEYKVIFEKYNLLNSFLITPTTTLERIRKIEKLSSGFIYVVSSSAITGKKGSFNKQQIQYFKKIKDLKLSRPYFIGFGIHNKETFRTACQYANGAIIGSEYIRQIKQKNTANFLTSLIK